MARRVLARNLLSLCLHRPATQALPAFSFALAAVADSSITASPQSYLWAQPSKVQIASYAKKAGKGKGKDKGAAEEPEDGPPVEFSIDEPTAAMQHTIERFQHELAGVRTGRANPGLIENLTVDVQGDKMPLKACGTVTVRGSQMLAVAVYDPSMVPDVIKAIKTSPLSLNPSSEGGEILVKVPKPSKDTIEKMVKLVHMEAESAKVTIRSARHKAMEVAKKAFSSKDDIKGAEKQVQGLTDKYIAEVERLRAIKDKELREHES